MAKDGRISIAGLNSKNVEYVAKAFHAVTKWLWLPFYKSYYLYNNYYCFINQCFYNYNYSIKLYIIE